MLSLKLSIDERVNLDWARTPITSAYRSAITLMFWELGLAWILKHIKLLKIYKTASGKCTCNNANTHTWLKKNMKLTIFSAYVNIYYELFF